MGNPRLTGNMPQWFGFGPDSGRDSLQPVTTLLTTGLSWQVSSWQTRPSLHFLSPIFFVFLRDHLLPTNTLALEKLNTQKCIMLTSHSTYALHARKAVLRLALGRHMIASKHYRSCPLRLCRDTFILLTSAART